MTMDISFDPCKDAINRHKHGVSLALAVSLEWDLMFCREDDRADNGELRLACYAPIGSKVYAVVFCEQDDTYRVSACVKQHPER